MEELYCYEEDFYYDLPHGVCGKSQWYWSMLELARWWWWDLSYSNHTVGKLWSEENLLMHTENWGSDMFKLARW